MKHKERRECLDIRHKRLFETIQGVQRSAEILSLHKNLCTEDVRNDTGQSDVGKISLELVKHVLKRLKTVVDNVTILDIENRKTISEEAKCKYFFHNSVFFRLRHKDRDFFKK